MEMATRSAPTSPTPTPDPDPHASKEHRFTTSPEPIPRTPNPGTDIEAGEDSTLRKLVQDYRLPHAVRASLDSWQKGANSLAVITALFAGVQISLVQLVVQDSTAGNSVAWRVLRWFMYAGVFIDLGGTASAIAIVNMASSATVTARSKALSDEDSLPRKLLEETEPIDRDLLDERNEMELLKKFGLSKRWEVVGWHMWISFTAGSIFIFTSLSIWIWLTEPTGVAAALMPIVIPALYPIIHVAWAD